MVSTTSSSVRSDTSVFPCVIFGSPLGPVSEHEAFYPWAVYSHIIYIEYITASHTI